MNPSMINAMTSMNALQHKLDIIANNLSNMNTIGYKRQDVTFQDILTSLKRQHPGKMDAGRLTDLGLTLGWGSQIAKQYVDFAQGSLQPTGVPTDVAIEGHALVELNIPRTDPMGFAVLDDEGNVIFDRVWTNHGAWQLTVLDGDPDGTYLATHEGHLLRTTEGDIIRIPAGHELRIDEVGRVYSRDQLDPTAEAELIGRLPIVQALRPELLENIGQGLFRLPEHIADENGVLRQVREEDDPEFDETMITFADAGVAMRQGFLEQSNVNLTAEISDLISMQRAYQLNARAITSSDMMMGLAVQLRG